jgi:galactonate dehydratase
VGSARLDLFECVVSTRTRWSFVRVRAADGQTGYGECSDAASDAAAELPHVAAVVAGLTHVDDAAPITAAVGALLAGSPSLARRTVLGGVEQALCDLASRRAGEPLWKWLGGAARSGLPLYANINRVAGPRLPRDVAAAGAAAVGSGFGTVKCAPFDVPLAGYALGEAGLARLRALRAAVGADVSIYVDCHERLAQDDVLGILPDLHRLDVAWLEDATVCTDLAGLRALRSATPIPLAGGEVASTPAEIRPAVEHKLLDVVMPDVKHAGGVLRAAQLAAAVPEAQISPHNPSGPIATAVSAHLAAALPNFSVLEYAYGEVQWRASIVGPAEAVTDGHLHLTDMPGLGVELLTTHSALHHVSSLTVEEK